MSETGERLTTAVGCTVFGLWVLAALAGVVLPLALMVMGCVWLWRHL